MSRSSSPDLMIDWKIPLPATLAGAVEYELMDKTTGKPGYGKRSKLIALLLSRWLFEYKGRKIDVDFPEDLVELSND